MPPAAPPAAEEPMPPAEPPAAEEPVPPAEPPAEAPAPPTAELPRDEKPATPPAAEPPAAEPPAAEQPAVPETDVVVPAAVQPKKKKTRAQRMEELSAPRIRDERIKPGCHVYKPPVRGLAYRGTENMTCYGSRRDGGMTYQHREENEKGDLQLRLRETRGNEKITLKDGEVEGAARQHSIESATQIRKNHSGFSAASDCSRTAGPSAPPSRRPAKQKEGAPAAGRKGRSK